MPIRPHQKALGNLWSTLLYDIDKRVGVLEGEAQHLMNAVAYRIGSGINSTQPLTNEVNFLRRVRAAAEALRLECETERQEIEHFKVAARNGDTPLSVGSGREFGWEHALLAWCARVVVKAGVLTERIGNLHDRLEQFFERTSPDHPDPTLRRRVEQGLSDKFLNEHTRWVHRDLANFVKCNLGAAYPFNAVPATFQSWEYDHTSGHHGFACYKTADNTQDESPNNRFVSLSLSYWMPERISLHPIIAHELAHQTLRDVYGRHVNPSQLQNDKSTLGHHYRRIYRCAEAWLGNRVSDPQMQVQNFALESTCDLLGATRYGYAYAHAWLLERLGDERIAILFHDERGMLRSLKGETKLCDTPADILSWFRVEVLSNASGYKDRLPLLYYRGVMLLRFLQSLARESDEFVTEFSNSFKAMLDVLLDIYADRDPTQIAAEKAFALDLAWTVSYSGKIFGGGASPFVEAAKAFWESPTNRKNDDPLSRQLITTAFREMVTKLANRHFPKSNALFNSPSVWTLHDVAWRLEWLLDKLAVEFGPSTSQFINARSDVRALLMVGMEDYLYRTANPSRLLQTILKRDSEERKQVQTALKDDTETNALVLGVGYEFAWMIELDQQIRSATGKLDSCEVDFHGQPLKLSDVELRWLDKIVFSPAGRLPNDWEDLLDSNEPRTVWRMELMQARGEGGALGGKVAVRSHKEAISPSSCGVLLGRYDFCVISNVLSANNAPLWKITRESTEACVCEETGLDYVSRTRRLLSISPNVAISNDGNYSYILVSLNWDASRTLVARWLKRELRDRYLETSIGAYLSDGWEDIVLMVPNADAVPSAAGKQSRLFELVTLINENPFVRSTETLLSSSTLSAPFQAGLCYRFVCRFGEDGIGFSKKLIELSKKHDWQLTIRNLVGNKDIEIVVDESMNSKIEAIHKGLHAIVPPECRLETRVSWSP